ncbi:Parallel beta-helix repeat [uncultured Caudovirales phage]|uniref:Parallel beta-helix repeat n=1 Tax=uncultured Caudovirales phage TaxID=2100421 RepID=A0A6J5SEL9_9CAUD|nr:Parallel beta-helix repeat [uncultured Caudovirales phage]CAB4182684.1 Parallel beta-helix repeat [uncultured Caudovirales phage]CAB4212682.1 Parallel beta-helix repeat [uncultured Caudovirales phage]
MKPAARWNLGDAMKIFASILALLLSASGAGGQPLSSYPTAAPPLSTDIIPLLRSCSPAGVGGCATTGFQNFKAPLSSAVSAGVSGPVNHVINVTDVTYGAKCDGATDDLIAFASAAATATVYPGSTIYVPPSATACMLSASFTLPTATTLWAFPGTVTIKPRSGNVSSPVLVNVANFATNSTISGIIFDGAGVNFANGNPLIQAYRVERLVFDQVIWQNSRGMGINVSSSNRSGVQNSKVINVGNHWVTTASAADRFAGLSFCCNTASGGMDNFVSNTYFENIGLDAINATNQTRFVTSNNRFNLTSNQTSVVTASDYPAAIYCNAGSMVISGNSIFGAIGNGVDTVACTVTISGNQISKSGAAGVLFAATLAGVLSGNSIVDNNQTGSGANLNFPGGVVFCSAVTNVTISGNRIGNQNGVTQQNGIYGRSSTIGTCTAPTFNNLVIATGNDLSNNVVAAIGGGAAGLLAALVAYTPQTLPPYTVAALPTCNGAAKYQTAAVSDATAPTYNATLAGGGAIAVAAFCNGTAWVAH